MRNKTICSLREGYLSYPFRKHVRPMLYCKRQYYHEHVVRKLSLHVSGFKRYQVLKVTTTPKKS